MHDDGHSVLVKQPENATEEAECHEALKGCPVDAIGEESEAVENVTKKTG
jgi:ferredoxin